MDLSAVICLTGKVKKMTELKEEILSFDIEVVKRFLFYFKKDVLEIAGSLEHFQRKLQEFDKNIDGHRQKALVECIFYNLINNISFIITI